MSRLAEWPVPELLEEIRRRYDAGEKDMKDAILEAVDRLCQELEEKR